MHFQNLQIETDALPSAESVEYQKLAPAYLKVAIIGNLLLFVFLFGLNIVLLMAGDWSDAFFKLFAPLLLLLLLSISTALIQAGYKVKGFALREKDILFRTGLIFRRETIIPFNRVQHCEIKQGPIERYFGLKTLEIFTAGGQSSDLSIPGLLPEEAQRLKDFIIRNAAENDPI
ncbi:MAG: PH domain-containing protein [Bacteroidota bacterium]